MSDRLDVSEFLSGYLAEVEEHLRAAGTNLLAVEHGIARGESNPRAVRETFRSLHTIKGLSAMVGVEPVVEIAHAMETVLREADRGGGRLLVDAVELLLNGVRAIEQRVAAVAGKRPVPPPPAGLVEALSGIRPAESATPPAPVAALRIPPEIESRLAAAEREQLVQGAARGRRVVRVDFVPSPPRAAAGITITTVRERIATLADIVKVVPLSRPQGASSPGGLAFALLLVTDATDETIAAAAEAAPDQVTRLADAAAAAPAAGPPPPSLADTEIADEGEVARRGVVRVEVSRLDDALEKLSSLVVSRFRLQRAVSDLAARGVDVRQLQEIVSLSARQLRDLRASIMRARMISVAEMLERVPLLVRGLGRSTGKQVSVEIDAGRAELDKSVAERLFPAIVHLVRNAVDHATETPEERRRAGKPEKSVLRVVCEGRANNQLELSISDDGRGIDRAAVAKKAGREIPRTDEELLDLLTIPGLSTRDEVTTTSGRGLGMDIVRRIAVDNLGGELSLRTTPGAGTTFTLRVPLTITIVDAFSFVVGPQPFVVPVAMVEEIIEVDPAKLVRGPAPGRSSRAARVEVRMLERRGEAMPLLRLDALFDLGDAGSAQKAIVVRRGGEPFAFAVDRMLGQQEVVVRPLEDRLVRIPGISGSTDLGDGRPTLVLDLVALASRAGRGMGASA